MKIRFGYELVYSSVSASPVIFMLHARPGLGAMQVYLDGAWHTFDPRNNARRIGRLWVAHGRDATDVAISTAFGSVFLESFRVWTDEISEAQAANWLGCVANRTLPYPHAA